jgi:hypothetical protein
MTATTTFKDALEARGPYAVWDLMTEDEREAAARALWQQGDRPTRAAIEAALAKEMKFRPQSLRKLSVDRVVSRLVRMVDELPDTVVFQFLFHLHMADRRALLAEFLDAVGLPHEDGVLDLPEDQPDPDPEAVKKAADALVASHGHEALVYLGTLRVADEVFWGGVDQVLQGFGDDGEAVTTAAGSKKQKTTKSG